MSDRNRTNGMKLDDALRALPLAAPERSAWPELAAQLRESRIENRTPERFRRFVVPAALAAALIGFFVIAHQARQTTNTKPTAIAGSRVTSPGAATISPRAASSSVNSVNVDASQLAVLQQRSQELEHWLLETGNEAAPLQGQDLIAATEIENLIGLVDVELAAPREARNADLWQRRVDLLADLSALRYSNYQLAAGGRFVAANSTN